MKKESYERIFCIINKSGISPVALNVIGKAITFVTAAVYLYVLLCSFNEDNWRELFALLFVPAVSFVLCSAIRTGLHAKRPYEIYGFKPLIAKDTKEKSFPSRHVFSIFVIGTSIVWVNTWLGAVLIIFGVVLGILRVCIGVHFPRDVVAGAVFGVLCGFVSGMAILA